jgi:hypothetical protein
MGSGIAKRAPSGFYTRTDAAQAVGRSKATLKRWEKDGLCAPSGFMDMGSLRVVLYSDADLQHLQTIASEQAYRLKYHVPKGQKIVTSPK